MNILLTGGSACGKSTYAEALAVKTGDRLFYVAAMEPYGEESLAKIARHRTMRAQKGFSTIERYTDVGGLVLPRRGTALLECLCNLTANEMFSPGGAGEGSVRAVVDGVGRLARQCNNLIVVTNDVGSDGGEYDGLTAKYIQSLGAINSSLAGSFDGVLELVCGIPLLIKGDMP